MSNSKAILEKVSRTENTGTLRIELSDVVVRPNSSSSALALLNKGDERFEQNQSRRKAWTKVTPEGLEDIEGVTPEMIAKAEGLAKGEELELGIAGPSMDGMYLRVQVQESTTPDDYQQSNVLTSAKQIEINEGTLKSSVKKTPGVDSSTIGQQGYFLTKSGGFIFSNTNITLCKKGENPEHEFVNGVLTSFSELQGAEKVFSNEGAEASREV